MSATLVCMFFLFSLSDFPIVISCSGPPVELLAGDLVMGAVWIKPFCNRFVLLRRKFDCWETSNR